MSSRTIPRVGVRMHTALAHLVLLVACFGLMAAWPSDSGGISRSHRHLDIYAPVTTDDSDGLWHTTSVTVTLTATDWGSAVAATYYRVDGGAWRAGTAVLVRTSARRGGNVGVHTVAYYSVDARGNVELPKVCYVRIDQAPDLRIVSPVNGSLSNSCDPSLLYSVGRAASVTVTLDGYELAARSGDELCGLADGVHTLNVEATSAGGLVGSDEVTFTVDASPPMLSASPPADSYDDPVLVTLSSSEDCVIRYSLDGFPPGPDASLYTGPFAIDGTTYLHALAVDAAGNQSTWEGVYWIDDSDAWAWIDRPTRGEVLSDSTPRLQYTVEEVGTSEVVTVDGVEVATRDYEELPELADGRHELVLTSTSETGDSSSDSVTFEVDTTGTTLTISPPGGEYSAPQEVMLSASEPAVIYWTDDPADPGPIEETGSVYNGNPLTITSDRTIRAVAVDGAGIVSATATATFSVRPPSKLRPEILTPTDHLITADQTPILAYVIRDADGNEVSDPDARVAVAVDGRETATRSGEALGALDDGLHTIDVDATNDAGMSRTSVDIVVDSDDALVAYDQDDSHLRFEGPWQRVSGPSHSAGSEMVLAGEGAVLAAFDGTMITVHGSTGPGMGAARVTVDDGAWVVDLYAPEVRADQLLFAHALPPGEHALKMEWTGERCADSSGTLVAIDGIRVAGTLSEAPNPLTVAPTLDGTGAASALISAEAGGSLETLGSDGTLYRLDLPSGAFLEDTQVSMQPVASVGGAPMSGGLIGGVELEPSGATLVVPATLRVTPPDAPNGDYLTVGYGYQSGGKEFHLKEAFIVGDAIELTIAHFSGFGLGLMTVSDVIAMQQNHAPTDPAAKVEQETVNSDVVASAEKLRVKAVQALGLAEREFTFFAQARTEAIEYLRYLRDHSATLPYRDLAISIQIGLRDSYRQCMQGAYLECGRTKSVMALAALWRWRRYLESDWRDGYFDLISDAVITEDLAHWAPKIQASDTWRVWCESGRETYMLHLHNLAEPPWQRVNLEARVTLQLASTNAARPVEGTGTSMQRTTFLSKWRYDEGWYWYDGRLTLEHGFESPVDLVVRLQPYLNTYPEYGRGDTRGMSPELTFAMPYVPGRFGGPLESWQANREEGSDVAYTRSWQTLHQWEAFSYVPPPEGPDDFFDTPDGTWTPGAMWVTRVREWEDFDEGRMPFAWQTYHYIQDNYNESLREATHFEVLFWPPDPTE